MNKLKEILVGWKNYVFKSAEHEKLAVNRFEECLRCDKLKKINALFVVVLCQQKLPTLKVNVL